MQSLLRTAILVQAAVGAAIIPEGYRLHETRGYLERNSLRRRELSIKNDAVIEIKIALVQGNLEDGYSHVLKISHPTSHHYGKHWTTEDVDKVFAPPEQAIIMVRSWLANATGMDPSAIAASKNGWLRASMTVSAAERAFATRYYEREDMQGRTRLGCDEYSLPVRIQHLVDYIVPGVKLSPPLRRRTQRGRLPSSIQRTESKPRDSRISRTQHPAREIKLLPEDLQDCGKDMTPACIRALYHMPRAQRNDSVNALGVFAEGDVFAQADLDFFYAKYASYIPQGTAPVVALIDGAQAPVALDDPRNEGESDLDLSMALSLVYPQSVVLYQTDDAPSANLTLHGYAPGFLNTFLDAMDGSYCTYSYEGLQENSPGIDPSYPDPLPGGYAGQLQCGVYRPTRVISISYDEAEADLPERYQKRQCNELMKLALRGHTIVASTGNHGVASYPGDGSPSGCLGQNETIFNPSVLSACPYVLSVGSTQLFAHQTVRDPESAVMNRYHGNGGFSNRYRVPSYQRTALSEYFALHDPGLPSYIAGSNDSNVGGNGGVYDRAGRGYPDVSANGAFFHAFTNGTDRLEFGTSLAAPLWASVITLLNEERTAVGKGPVGFIHPTLYENPSVLNDITNGSNPGCRSKGFTAVKGWDPVTGLGTPNYPKLLELFLSLP